MLSLVLAVFGSLMFFIATLLLFAPYAAVLSTPLLWLRHHRQKKFAAGNGCSWSWRETFELMAKRLILVYLALHIGFYAWQWCKWNFVDNANYSAKQYFAVGQVTAAQRKTLTLVRKETPRLCRGTLKV